ncbi:Tigger transposable element-derived protein 2 [Mactra antiquata]
MKVLGDTFCIGKSTAADIIKKRDVYLREWENNSNSQKQRFNAPAKFDKVNDLVFEWFSCTRAKNINISGVLIQEKAKHFAQQLGIENFKASNGWLDKFKTKHSIKCFRVSGESAGVDVETVDSYKERLPEIVSGYASKDIFNCDEAGLNFRALPEKTLAVSGQSTSGTKQCKDRVTILFACSASGEKLKPLVIGKYQNPRCLKNVDRSALPVSYSWSKKAWMNYSLFEHWIKCVNSDMKRQGRHILMFLDNASSHGNELTLSNVTLKFLPANTTSHLQPLDQGVIRNFKGLYRKHL